MSIVDSLSLTSWTRIGPSPIKAPGFDLGLEAGRIEAAAPHPMDPDTMFIATGSASIWRTTNWNDDPPTWDPLGDTQESLQCGGYHPLVVHPAAPNLVMGVMTGHGAGVLVSANGGISWQLLANPFFEGAQIGSIAVHPTNTNVMYVSVWWGGPGGGVYKSTDGGLNWSNTTSSFHFGGASDVIIARWSAHTLFACLVWNNTSGVYRSSDAGATWTLQSGLPSGAALADAGRLSSGRKRGVVYASCLSNGSNGVVVKRARTGNGGRTWTQLANTPGDVETRSWHLVLGVDPANDKRVICNDAYRLFESTDSGQTWSEAETFHDDWVNVAFGKNGQLVATADRNVYRRDSQTNAWKSKEGNLQVTQFYDITLDQSDPNTIYGIGQDQHSGMKFSNDLEWSYLTAGDEIGRVRVDPTNSSRLYVSVPRAPNGFVSRSTDGGQTWKVILMSTDFVANDYDFAYKAQKAFVIDPSNPKRLLIGTNRVWETTNATAATPTWKAISPVLSSSATPGDRFITALAVAPSDPTTIYAATADGHLWLTSDGGASWGALDAGLVGSSSGPDAGRIFDIRIDPKNPVRAFAVGGNASSVWYLDGVSLPWRRIVGDLPTYLGTATILSDLPLFATETLYLGTSRGVYRSSDLGLHWTLFADLPKTSVTDLQLGAGALFAATAGYGVWAIALRPSLVKGNLGDLQFGPGHVGPGDPVEGIKVALETEWGGRVVGLETVSDKQGNFAIGGVPPGTYRVRLAAPAGYELVGRHREVITVNGSEIRDLDARFMVDPARAASSYADLTSFMSLPGRRGQPLVGREEGEGDEQGEEGRRARKARRKKAPARRRRR